MHRDAITFRDAVIVIVRDDPLVSTHDSKIFFCYGLFRTHFETVSALFANCMMPPES